MGELGTREMSGSRRPAGFGHALEPVYREWPQVMSIQIRRPQEAGVRGN